MSYRLGGEIVKINKDNKKNTDTNLSEDYKITDELLNEIYIIKNQIKYINKNTKKSIISIESLKKEVLKDSQQSFRLKKELEISKDEKNKTYKVVLYLLDKLDEIYDFAILTACDKDFLNNIKSIKKLITKEIYQIQLVEIKSEGELFNPEVHRCIGIKKDTDKQKDEIVGVIEKGYMIKGRVIRPASVIVAK